MNLSKKSIIIIASVVTVLFLVIPATVLLLIPRGGSDYIDEPALVYPGETVVGNAPALTVQPDNAYQFTIAPSALGQIAITPLSVDSFGVARDSAFLITSETQTLTEGHLRQFLTVGNEYDFLLTPQADNAFLLSFEQELSPAQVYNFIYSPPEMQPTSHAFQTVDVFRVTATTPATSTHNIPLDSGIEVTFSQPLANAADFESAFSIDPLVGGSFLARGNTYIFAPSSLEPNTVYTVTIALEELEEAYTFSFTTRWGMAAGRPFSISGSVYETFLPWTEVFIALNVSTEFEHRDFYVNIYDLQTAENFLNFVPGVSDPGQPIEELSAELMSIGSDWQTFHYLFLGRTLPQGYYLATIRSPHDTSGVVLHKFIQVSAISVYSLAIAGETVFWVHDATTHQPAVGAQISVGNTVVVTDSQGVAVAQTPAQSSRQAITIQYGNYLPFAYTTRTFAPPNLTPNGRFLTYMYTDRPIYRPDDTVDIFGVILPRPGQQILPGDTFVLRFGDMLEFPITLDEHGAFNKRVPVTGMFDHIEARVEVNGERLMSAWLNFMDYTNRSFIVEGSVDRNAYFAVEYAQLDVNVTNFAGAPLEGVNLLQGWQDPVTVATTDTHGLAQGALPAAVWARTGESWGWQPNRTAFWLTVSGNAQATQEISFPYIIAPRDIMLEVEMPNDTTAILTSSRITLDRLNAVNGIVAAEELLSDRDNFRGESVDIDFTVTITRHVTTRTIRQQQYDHINRRTINTYDFNTTSSVYRTTGGRTVNGTATVYNLPTSTDPLIRYTIEATYNDSRGLATRVTIGANHWSPYVQESSIRHFGFTLENRINQNVFDHWWFAPRDLRVGESTNVILMEGQMEWGAWVNPTTPTTGRVLTVLVRDGVISTTVGSPQGTPITLPEEAISNALIFGAYFDAGYIFPIPNPISVHYNYEGRNLQIALDFDQAAYSPGSEVTARIQTTDANGRPVPARVTISVVDESAILDSWGGHRANFLSRLYRSSMISTWDMPFYQFASHIQHNFGGAGGGAEGGGGGDGGTDGFRAQFIDNPIFEVIHTDATGIGTITFTLPDQITSWRVTALAITTDGLAGDNLENVISTLPFHVNLLVTNEYIVGDDIAAAAVVVTDSGVPTGDIEFVFEVLKDGEILHTYTTTSHGRAEFNAGKLGVGSYVMQVSATMGNYRDGMELPFTVVESGMIIPVRTVQQISPDNPNLQDFAMRQLPVRVTFTNGNIRPLMNILHGTINHTSFRTDHIAAAAFANAFHSGISEQEIAGDVRRQVQPSWWRGVPQLTYENSDFYYTARFAASFPYFVNSSYIVRFVEQELNRENYPVRRAAGLWALAAMGEPVLLDVYEVLEQINDTMRFDNNVYIDQYMEHLYLIAALVSLGDDATAASLMQNMPSTADVRFVTGWDVELINTLKLFINMAINPPAAWEHLQRGYENTYVSDVPERINFVRRAVVLGQTISEVQYDLNGVTHTLRLENFDRRTLLITAEQFDNLNLIPISGETDFFIDFYSYDARNWESASNRLTIARSIVQDGGLIRVDLRVSIPRDYVGSFVIYDRLPSNLRFVPVRQTWQTEEWFSVRNTQRQLIEVRFFQSRHNSTTRTFSYHAVQLFEGDMASGTAYITNNNRVNHVWAATE